VGGGEPGPQRLQAVIAGFEVVTFAGDQTAIQQKIELPAKFLIGEDFAHGDAAGRDPIEKQQARRRMKMNLRALGISRPGMGDERFGDPFEGCVCLDAEFLVAYRRGSRACPIDPRCGRRAEYQVRARRDMDVGFELVSIEKSGGGIDDAEHQPSGVEVGFAEVNGRAETLMRNDRCAVRAA